MPEDKIKTKNNGKATAATRAKNKYRDANYDRAELTLPKGMKGKILEVVNESEKYKSLNSYIEAAIKEKWEREGITFVDNQ